MRQLLYFIAALAVLPAAFATMSDRMACLNNPDDDCDTLTVDDAAVDSVDYAAGAMKPYYGDTLYQYNGKTVIYDYSGEDDPEVSSLTSSRVMTYAGYTPVDSCVIVGNGVYEADGETLNLIIGVDTVGYDMRYLPDSVDPVRALLPPDAVRHHYSRRFALSDSSFECDFKFLAYLPESHPAWLNQFIVTIMRNDIQAMYLDDKGAGRVLNEYYGLRPEPKKVDGINAAGMSPEDIARHFATLYEELYRKEYDYDDVAPRGPKFDYMLEVAPEWISADGRYATYRFYSYYYTMGMHGFMEEYYITFDNHSGRLLGYRDIFGDLGFPEAIRLLETQLTKRRTGDGYGLNVSAIPAAMDESDLEANASEIIKELYQGSYYPRPALTERGVVFSYQPYEKGAFAEGILHFLIPYSSLTAGMPR